MELKKVDAKLVRYYCIKEEFWKQKSSLKWFKDGDRNTKIFHFVIKDRRKYLHISEIQDNTW